MFLLLPSLTIIFIYFIAAVLPAVFLMRYIYREDTIEKESTGLLVSLVFCGFGAALIAIVLETLGQGILSAFLDSGSPFYTVTWAFLVVAVVEEGAKFLLLKARTWKSPEFNYRFDGIVYAVFVSLGFAAFENVGYVFGYGLSVAIPRAFLAIPAHMGFAVFMGSFYGRAKVEEDKGNLFARNANLWAGYIIAVLLHGFYDTCASLGNVLSTLLYIAFVIIMYILVFRKIRKESRSDMPV